MLPEFAPYADRLHTAALGDPALWRAETARVVVLTHSPYRTYLDDRFTTWPEIAPQPSLRRAFRLGCITWDEFTAKYLLHLARWERVAVWRDRLLPLLARAPSVTLVGLDWPSDGEIEAQVRCHRRILRSWLLGEVGVN